MEKKEVYFEVGDLVTCSAYGHGKVVENDGNPFYPVTVEFISDFGIRGYTFDGRLIRDGKRTLHQGHIEIKEHQLIPKGKFKIGDVVFYCDKIMKVTGFDKDGAIVMCTTNSGIHYDLFQTDIIPLESHPLLKDKIKSEK